MPYKYLPISIILITSSLQITFAQSRIYVNEYLNIGVGAEQLAKAGAAVASSKGVYAGYWNPAGILHMKEDMQVSLMHAEYFAGIFKYDYAAFALPINKGKQAIGFSFLRFATDNIPYTLDYVRPDGSLDDTQLRGFSAGDYAGIFHYAHKLGKQDSTTRFKTNLGINAKVIYRNVGTMAKAWGFGIDLGLQSTYKDRLHIGLMFKDITTTYTSWSFNFTEEEKRVFYRTGNDVPIKSYETMMPRLNAGIGYDLIPKNKKIQVYAELGFDITSDGKRNTVVQSNTFSIDPKMGLEASYKNVVFLRGGIGNFYQVTDNSDTLNQQKYTVFQPSVGVGFHVKTFTIDYAFTSLLMQDNPLMSHIFSLRINFNKQSKKNTDMVVPTVVPANNNSTL